MIRILAWLMAFTLAAAPAYADVCAANSKKAADNAVTLLSYLPAMMSFCAPCGDTGARRLPIQNARVAKDGDGADAFQVLVSDQPIDLAYIYIPKSTTSKTWINLGLVVRCAPVTAFDPLQLPDNMVAP